MNKQKIILLSVVSLLILFAFGTFAYNSNKSDETALIAKKNEEKFIRDYSTINGNIDAEVTLVEFLDPSCETCRAFYPIIQDIMANYKGKIKGQRAIVGKLKSTGKWKVQSILKKKTKS